MPRTQPQAIRVLWQLRKEGHKGQLDAVARANIVETAGRHATVKAAAAASGRSRPTVSRVLEDWKANDSIVSPRRGNSGRPRTACSPAVVKRVVREMKRPRDGDPIPTAREVKRRLSLPYTTQSIRNAARVGGLSTQAIKHTVFLTAVDRRKRELWARKMCRRPFPVNWNKTVCSDEKVFVLKQHQKCAKCAWATCWVPGGSEYSS